jgi:hypothetical protein
MKGFIKVCAMNLERDSEGRVVTEVPAVSRENLSFKDGQEPLCKFKVSDTTNESGVFIIKVDKTVKYVGGVSNISRFFYGGCSRMNPDDKLWPGKCRLKKGIPEGVKRGKTVEVWFFRTDDAEQRRSIKMKLSKALKPEWDRRW